MSVKVPDGWRKLDNSEEIRRGDKILGATWIRKLETPTLVWRKEPPDTPGVWKHRHINTDGLVNEHLIEVRDVNRISCAVGRNEFCRITDLPVIAEPTPPVQYRDVTIADLVNGPIECEVSDDGVAWCWSTVDGYVHGHHAPFWRIGKSNPKYARVPVGPAAKSPREWWLHIGGCGIDTPTCKNALVYTTPQSGVSNIGGEKIHVREVLP